MTKHSIATIRTPSSRLRSMSQLSGATLTVGTQVLTANGDQLVEDLKPGDVLITRDYGPQKLQYIAFHDLNLIVNPDNAPIKVHCQGFGFETPSYFAPDQLLSCRHPMFEMMFGASEVLIRCGDLKDAPGFEPIVPPRAITYVALGFLRRQILRCNGGFIEIGHAGQQPHRTILSPEEACVAAQLLEPKLTRQEHRSFPLH